MRKIKVVHICSSLDGGAGLCTKRIIQSTSLLGIENYILTKEGFECNNIDIVEKIGAKGGFVYYFQKILNHFHIWPKSSRMKYLIEKAKISQDIYGIFTSPITEYRISNHKWIANADIIHIHWVGDFLDYESFFHTVKKPIIWTMHDENAGYGGFHYTLWRDMSTTKAQKLDNSFAKIKKRAYSHTKKMHLVAISSMMQDFISKNDLLKGFPCTLIYNGINENDFSLIDKHLARKALGIENNSMVFIFVAFYIHDERKGLKTLLNSLEKLIIHNTTLICLGHYNDIPEASFDIRCEGYITNTRLLSLYYSASDFLITPSYQEAFSQTPLESMACGTPVIAFPFSGTSETICPSNGIICADFTEEALILAIKEAINRHYDRDIIRQKVIDRFSYKIIGNQYKKLYEQSLLYIS